MPSKTATSELASELRVSLMRLARRLRAERLDEGLTPTQLAVLGTLDRHGPTRTTAILDERGLLTRVSQELDRRQVRIAISDAGLALLREDRKRRDAWLAGRFDQLTSDERALLHQVAPLLDRLAQS
jgi:DNA-binding MarR family transcriptional regulator